MVWATFRLSWILAATRYPRNSPSYRRRLPCNGKYTDLTAVVGCKNGAEPVPTHFFGGSVDDQCEMLSRLPELNISHPVVRCIASSFLGVDRNEADLRFACQSDDDESVGAFAIVGDVASSECTLQDEGTFANFWVNSSFSALYDNDRPFAAPCESESFQSLGECNEIEENCVGIASGRKLELQSLRDECLEQDDQEFSELWNILSIPSFPYPSPTMATLAPSTLPTDPDSSNITSVLLEMEWEFKNNGCRDFSENQAYIACSSGLPPRLLAIDDDKDADLSECELVPRTNSTTSPRNYNWPSLRCRPSFPDQPAEFSRTYTVVCDNFGSPETSGAAFVIDSNTAGECGPGRTFYHRGLVRYGKSFFFEDQVYDCDGWFFGERYAKRTSSCKTLPWAAGGQPTCRGVSNAVDVEQRRIPASCMFSPTQPPTLAPIGSTTSPTVSKATSKPSPISDDEVTTSGTGRSFAVYCLVFVPIVLLW